eukprot:m.61268 g.61268  ORF g.61268 m.61268 type:complete len:731 (-) comp13196_c0_seq1:73-2265(-)
MASSSATGTGSSSASDSVEENVWIIEGHIGDALLERERHLRASRPAGLGPADLCHTVWSVAASSSLMRAVTSDKFVGAYHTSVGLDASGPAHIAAYYQSLMPAKLHDNPNAKLHKGKFCTYNAFSQCDVHVEVEFFPGAIQCYSVDARGHTQDVSELAWQQAHVCSVLRTFWALRGSAYRRGGSGSSGSGAAGHPDTGSSWPPPQLVFPPMPNPQAEAPFLAAAANVFWHGERLGPCVGRCPSLANNFFANEMLNYFLSKHRYDQAELFFSQFVPHDPEVATLVAKVLCAKPKSEPVRALKILAKALLRARLCNVPLLIEQSKLLGVTGNLEAAVAVAKAAATASLGDRQSWLNLAGAYQLSGRTALCLAALNTLNLGATESRPVSHRQSRPASSRPRSSTLPSRRNRSGSLKKIPFQSDRRFARLKAPSFDHWMSKAYRVVVSLYRDLGWEELLKLRAQVFLVEPCPTGGQEDAASVSSASSSLSSPRAHGGGSASPGGSEDGSSAKGGKIGWSDGAPVAPAVAVQRCPAQPHGQNCYCRRGEDRRLGVAGADTLDDHGIFVRRRLCKPWLDELFWALHEDLCAHHMLQTKHDLGQEQRLAVDYMRIGNLFDRLGLPNDAAKVYWMGIHTDSKSVGTGICLLRHEVKSGSLGNAILALTEVVPLLPEDSHDLSTKVARAQIAECVFSLVATHGLSQVEEAAGPFGDEIGEFFATLRQEVKMWGVDNVPC